MSAAPDDSAAELLRERIKQLLAAVSLDMRPCKLCGAVIALVRTRGGSVVPYTLAGLNHFVDCPFADSFRRRNKAPHEQQQQLFDSTPHPR